MWEIYPLLSKSSLILWRISASQGYGRVSFSAVWLLMPVRHKPLSRLTGCGRLIRIIAPPVPLFSATRTVGSPLYSIRGREEVSLCPCRLIALCLPHRDDEMRLSLGLCHLRAASSAAPSHGICTRKLIWNCQCSKKEKNPFTNNQVLGGQRLSLKWNFLKTFWLDAPIRVFCAELLYFEESKKRPHFCERYRCNIYLRYKMQHKEERSSCYPQNQSS